MFGYKLEVLFESLSTKKKLYIFSRKTLKITNGFIQTGLKLSG